MAGGSVQERMAGGVRWSYRQVAGDGPPLLFLHAFPLQKAMWDPILTRLEGTAEAVAVDLPGFGGSDLLPDPPTMDRYADALASLIDEMGLARVVVCGLSMGGYVAFALWRRHRARLAGLVLADTRAVADTDQAREARYRLVERLEQEGARAAVRQSLPDLVGPTTRSRRPELLRELEGWILGNGPQGMSAASRAMARRPDFTELLPGISVPTLVVVGEEDELSPPAEAQRMAAAIPGASLARIAQAGHLSALEQPESFSRAVLDFLARLPG